MNAGLHFAVENTSLGPTLLRHMLETHERQQIVRNQKERKRMKDSSQLKSRFSKWVEPERLPVIIPVLSRRHGFFGLNIMVMHQFQQQDWIFNPVPWYHISQRRSDAAISKHIDNRGEWCYGSCLSGRRLKLVHSYQIPVRQGEWWARRCLLAKKGIHMRSTTREANNLGHVSPF